MTKSGSDIGGLGVSLAGYRGVHSILASSLSSVKGQGVTVESCHLLLLSNPSPPIICSCPPSLLLPDAVRSNDRLSSEQNFSLHVRSVLEQDGNLMLSSAGLAQRARKQITWGWSEWMDGRIEGLPTSLFLFYSTSLHHNPGRIKPLLPPPTPFSPRPSIPPSLSLSLTVSDSLALIFSRLLSDLLSFPLFFPCFFSTLILHSPLCFFPNNFLLSY